MPLNQLPRTEFSGFQVTGADCSATLRAERVESPLPTVPTAAGTLEVILHAPAAGTLTLARVAFKDALATDNTNKASFLLKNKSNSNADMLDTGAGNSTATTGGSALTAYTSRSLTLNATAANLVVAAGDVLVFQVTGAGTLANTLTEGNVKLVFDSLA